MPGSRRNRKTPRRVEPGRFRVKSCLDGEVMVMVMVMVKVMVMLMERYIMV